MSAFSLGKILKLLEKANDQGVNISYSQGGLSVHVEKGKAIGKELLEDLKANKPDLVHYFQNFASKGEKAHLAQLIPLFDRNELKQVPVSFSQERLWFTDQLEGSIKYHLPIVLRLKGKLDIAALNYTFKNIINRHEVLRTIIREEEGQAFQYVKEKDNGAITLIDGAQYDTDAGSLQNFIRSLIRAPFNLAQDHMVRAHLIQLKQDESVLVFAMHHIASDAWSASILVKEVAELYSSFIEQREARLPVLRAQYADFAVWQRNYLQGEVLQKKLDYWKLQLEGASPLQLPTDHPRPPVQGSRGENIFFSVDKEISNYFQKLSQQQGTTLYMTLLTAFNILLYRYCGQKDICVGTSIASREQQELEGLIGFFVNTLVFRNQVNGDETYMDLLQQVRSTTLQAYEHQDVSFEKVVDIALSERDPSRHPLFQVMLVLKNTPELAELRLGDLKLIYENYEANISKFDFTFFVNETPAGFQCNVQYSSDLFTEETIIGLVNHFKELLTSIAKDPNQKIGLLPMLTKQEEQQLLVTFNSAEVAYPKDKSVIGLFEEQVAKSPDNIALVFEDEQITYAELNGRANQLAHHLKSYGLKDGALVPLYMERGAEMMIAMIGIMKAGGAYVPVDMDFPQDRISYMLEDSAAKLIVSNSNSSSVLEVETGVTIIDIDQLTGQSTENLSTGILPGQLAYVIYTSGSTGKPKGVMIEHRNLVDYYFGLNKFTQIDQCRSFALVSTIATDLGNTVIYASLLSGGTLHLFTKESVSNIELLHTYFSEHAIDCLKIVPSHWKALSQENSLLLPKKLLVFGGEALPSDLVNNIRNAGAGCKIVNHYGPTETTIGKLLHVVNQENNYSSNIPIGMPFSNTRVYVLSKELQLSPIGVPGQLYITGDGVARGYYNNPELTTEKFIKNPFEKNRLMYGTGDLVKYLPDGNILFIGRVDDQVKIRGYRIELGEIETVLQQSELISEAVVLAKEDHQGNKRLIAYIVPEDTFDREGIITYLKEKLPEYMVPALLMELESLPLMANGKVDRKLLPDPDAGELLSGQYVAPRNEVEAKLATMWETVLEVDQVGMHDDFFELGGHSLLAVRLISLIRKAFTVEMPIGDIFDYPTVALLAKQVEKQSGQTLLPTIEIANPRPDKIPLSFSQERLWFIDQLEGSVQYHISAVLNLKGTLSQEALAFALQNIINRHEVLRTVIREEDGRGYQFIQNKDAWQLNIVDGTAYNKDLNALQQFIRELVNQPFNLAHDYMLRADLIKIGNEQYTLVVTLHHIASDGWSASIIVKELVELYNAFYENRPAELPILPLQYADFAIWQREYLQGEVLKNKLAYWKENLYGVEPLQLPTDFVRPVVQSTRGASARFNIDKDLVTGIQQLSQQQGTSVFMTLLTAFKVLLYRYSGQQDICVGTPIAGRQQQELEGLIGFFINTLALRSEITDTISFAGLLQQVRATTLKAYEHQELPFEKVVEVVAQEREISRSPVFQVMFILQNTPPVDDLRLGKVELSREMNEHDKTKFELMFSMSELAEGMNGTVEYCADLYTAETIGKMITHFKALLQAVVTAPQQQVGLLPMLSPAEEQQLLIDFNDTATSYPSEKSIIDLFEKQVEKTPQSIALDFEGKQLTYQQLNERSNQLAHYLRGLGINENTLIPICIERSIDVIVAVIAILKAGGAYVPVDPDYPLERVQYMIADINAPVIISSKESSKNIQKDNGAKVLEIDSDWTEIEKQPKGNLQSSYQPQQLAYMLYTSGSTGKPKGVKMHGGALVNLLSWQEKQFVNKQRRVLQFASLNFDVSFQEIFSTLCFGSTLYLIDAERRKDVAELMKDILNNHITHLFVPYIVLKNLADNIVSMKLDTFYLEEVIVAGEQLKLTDDIQFLLKENIGNIINQYGPTEAHVVSSYTVNKKGTLPPLPPIGKPIDNTRLYILGTNKQLVPVGVSGELYIGGVQVAQGYMNQPQQTAEKFIADIFSNDPDARLYKTGDLARLLPDGNIEYLGRMDDQVKIRGFRIELGEVESCLQECACIRQAVVMAKEDNNGNKRLIGYVVPEGTFDKEAIIAYAKSKLPEYMVPSLWVQMESLPVTRNGKIDKKALPNPDASELIGNAFVAPGNKTEQQLADIWSNLLGVEKVGVHDNFFELGGHSLLATRIVSAIRKEMKVELPIKELFLHPTIAGLALQVDSQTQTVLQPSIQVQQRPERIPLSFSQERLWFIDSMEGSLHYHIPAVIRLNGKLNIDALEGSLQAIIERHEVLRTIFLQEEGQAYQQVKSSDEWRLVIEDGMDFKAEPSKLRKYTQQLLNKPFDLSKDYMLRGNLIVLGAEEYVLAVNMHHIAADGWSISILVKEIAELYKAFVEDRTPQMQPLPVQYADFAIWQRLHLQGDTLNKKLSYWKQKLEGTAPLQVPTDFPRPAIQSLRGSNAVFKIDKEITLQLIELCKQQGTTLFMTLLAAFKVLMYRYTGQQDICVGTPIAGRLQQETEGLIGFFINTLALRSEVSENELFTALLQQVKLTTLEAYEHQEVPFEKVVDAVVKERDLSRNALFQVMLVLQNTPESPALQLGDVTLIRDPYEQTVSKFDMALFLTETTDGLNGVVQYCTDLFTPATIEKLIAHLHQLIVSIVAQPAQKIGTIQMLSKAEETQLLVEFNDTARDYPLDKSIVCLFEEQVIKTPDAIAVVFGNETITYRELNHKANQLACFLRRKGVTDKSIVPICIERSQAMVIGLLGILKAGATYVPIDPEYPIDRVTYMVEDSGAKIVVSNKASLTKLLGIPTITVIDLDEEQQAIAKEATANIGLVIGADDLVYVIYTSGSTGKPKGVMVKNRGVVNLLLSMRDDVNFTSSSSFFSVTTYSFDICYLELYLPLLTGGKLIVVPREIAIDGFRLKSLLEFYQPTHMQATPATWLLLLDSNWENKEGTKILIGGEAVKENIKEQLTKRGSVYNVYGPTETTIWSVMKQLKSNEKVLIGKPIANTGIFILGQNLQLVPAGVSGEICISGAGLARGYLNRPELTNEKFIPHPFAKEPGDRLYKTGDLGRWLNDGNIECLGRIDDQVKLRGYRIELGEIEAAMLQSNLVSQAVVLVKEDQQNNSRLISYYLPQLQVIREYERTLAKNKVAGWKDMYESEYASRGEKAGELSDTNIWKNSFDGTLINEGHIQERADEIVGEVLQGKPEIVLEIGTGTGMIFNKLAGKVKQYIGTDFSGSSIGQLNQRIEKSSDDFGTATFKICAPHEVELSEHEKPDTILLNSVVQYFPSENYLTEVIGKSVSLLKGGKGRVVIGDVRDNRLLAIFKSQLQLQKAQHSVSLPEFAWAVNQEILNEEELCISPAYFYALTSIYPQITNVEIKWKQASYINELSAYRYTVILYSGVEKQVILPDWKTLENAGGKQSVLSQFEKSIPVLALKHVANPRLGQEKLLSSACNDKTVNSVGELLQLIQAEDAETNDIIQIISAAQLKNYRYTLIMDEDPFRVNLLLQLNPADAFIQTPIGKNSLITTGPFTNIPLFNDISLLIQKDLRTALQKTLPEYMVPSDFIALYQLPLTNNGKVDRKFLSQRQDRDLSNKLNYQAPETDIEIKLATIWQNLLGVERAGINDNFFELGGHSLLAMRVISAIRKEFEVELVIKDLFQFTTIRELSKYLEVQLNIYSEDNDASEYELLNI